MNLEKTILVIDDDLDFQLMIGNMLRTSGFIVKTQLDGNVNHTLDSAKGCDMVLLDIELPGLSGVDLGKKLKSSPETLNIPIIMMSGHPECQSLFAESKANALIPKPFPLSRLMAKIRELLPR